MKVYNNITRCPPALRQQGDGRILKINQSVVGVQRHERCDYDKFSSGATTERRLLDVLEEEGDGGEIVCAYVDIEWSEDRHIRELVRDGVWTWDQAKHRALMPAWSAIAEWTEKHLPGVPLTVFLPWLEMPGGDFGEDCHAFTPWGICPIYSVPLSMVDYWIGVMTDWWTRTGGTRISFGLDLDRSEEPHLIAKTHIIASHEGATAYVWSDGTTEGQTLERRFGAVLETAR